MKTTLTTVARGLGLALCLASALAFANPGEGPGGHGMHHHGPGCEPGGGPGMGGPMAGHLPSFLHGVTLTDAQKDKIFEIHHALAPALRDKAKVVHKARSELRAMAEAGTFDEARVRALADTAARAEAELAVMHARSAHQVQQLLTAEQKKQIEAQRARFESRMKERGEPERGEPRRNPGRA